MRKISLGLIGCGKQAEKHINCIKKNNIADLWLSDINNEHAKLLAQKTGVAWRDNSDQIISDPAISAILICTPTPSHANLIVKALNACKDVFCEKPLCLNKNEAFEIAAAEGRSGKSVQIGYVYRHVPVFEEGFRIVSQFRMAGNSSILGRPLVAFFRLGGRGGHQLWKHRKEQGGGAINEMLVHMVDLANWYFGPLQSAEVICRSRKLKNRLIQDRIEAVDAEDFIMVRLYNDAGVELFCQADLLTPAFTQFVEIQFENGTFMGSIQPEMPSFIFLKNGRDGYPSGRTDLFNKPNNVFDRQMHYFITNLIKQKRPDRNTVADTISIIELIDDIQISQRKQHEKN